MSTLREIEEPQRVSVRLLRKQNEFRLCESKWAAARGGIGSGKTTAICWWLIDRLEEYPNASHYVVGADFDQVRRGIFQSLTGIMEQALGWESGVDFRFRGSQSEAPSLTIAHSGAKLLSLTAEQGQRIRSVEFQTLACEEPQTWHNGEDVYHTLIGRLRHSQRSFAAHPGMQTRGRLSFNPPSMGSWIYDLVERYWPKMAYPCWQFSLRDNVLLPDHQEYIKQIEGQTPQHLWAVEIDGDWRTVGAWFFPVEDVNAAVEKRFILDKDAVLGPGEILFKQHAADDYGRLAHGEAIVDGIPWHNVYPKSRYVHFWDLADKQDWTVGITIDATYGDRMTVVEFERFHKTGWKHVYARIRDRHARYQIGLVDTARSSASKTYIDSTGVGDAILDELVDIKAEGFKFTATSKAEILAGLQSVLSQRELKYPMIPVMFDELKYYERDDKALVQDCVMALAGAVHYSKRRPRFSGSAVV